MEHANIHGGVVRRLWPSDMPAFRDHLLRLDAQSRHDRFAMAVSGEIPIDIPLSAGLRNQQLLDAVYAIPPKAGQAAR